MPVWLQCLSCKIQRGSSSHGSPFLQRSCALQEQSEVLSFCIFYCLLFLDCTSAGKVRQIFAAETEKGGQQAARHMHRFPFPTSPAQDSLNSFFVNRARWNGESSIRAACSAGLAPSAALPCFTDLYSSWWLTCPPAQPLSLASTPQCHEKRDCLLTAAPFAPTDSHRQQLPKPAWRLPLGWHQWHPLLAQEQILLWVPSNVLQSW